MSTKGIVRIDGIKCDNPDCDYKNKMIQPQEYEFWVNKPCPKCGEIIFTNEEYNLYKLLMATTAIANNVTSDQSTSLPAKTGKVYNPTTKNSQ